MSDRGIDFPAGGVGDGGIRLRLPGEDDRNALVTALQGPEFGRWTRVPHPYAAEDADVWLVKQAEARDDGTGLHLVVVGAADDGLLGGVGLTEIYWGDRRANIGYWVARESRRRGVATRAVRLLARWTFDSLPVERLAILVDVRNAASAGVAERAGFAREGVLRSFVVVKGTARDVVSYSLLPDELGGEQPASGGVR